MVHTRQEHITDLLDKIGGLSIEESLQLFEAQFPGQVCFSTSFSVEDQVITHKILSGHIPVFIFTLDTGRLFSETYSVWSRTNELYQTKILSYNPDRNVLEDYLNLKGPNAFYESVANRKECCYIRKVEPLKRALEGKSIWVTGLRAEHSADRNKLSLLEWDENNKLIKYNPLLLWTTEQVDHFIRLNDIPYNPLHDKGFVSIGCAPCTRAIKPGEDFRAGRWWWEDNIKKECGLHVR